MKYLLFISCNLFAIANYAQELKQPLSCCDAYYETNRIMDTITIVIDGIVIDGNSQKPIENAAIIFDNGQTTYQLTSDKKGKFSLFHVSSGEYSLSVSADNYCTVNVQLKKFGTGSGIDMMVCLSRSQ